MKTYFYINNINNKSCNVSFVIFVAGFTVAFEDLHNSNI